jgi:tRNA(Ile)-lysidine synthase
MEKSIRARNLFSRGDKILVAVSGGMDSMVLLHALARLAPPHGWKLVVAHFNHCLRGRSSDADEKLAHDTARKLGLPFVAGRGDVCAFALRHKLSIEMAARQLRHEFLAREARRRKISTIALAHHADDQVELFFLRLLRGSGGEGLAGMKWLSSSPAGAATRLARPLLGVTKADLEKFARENGIRFREDASNRSPDFLRNRIRRELLPLLRKHYQLALDRTILRVMEIVGAEAEFVGEAAGVRPAKKVFAKLPVAVQRRMLQRQLEERGIAVEFDLVEQLRGEAGRVVTVGAHRQVWRDAAGRVREQRGAGRAGPAFRAGTRKVDLKGAGAVDFGGRNFAWKVEPQTFFRRPDRVKGREFFDADKVGGRVVLRHWRAGDRFRPIGMGSAVKLQDLFVNEKVPRGRRHELVVAATAAGGIFWVEGLRIGEDFKLSPLTRRRLRWEWQNQQGCGQLCAMV